MSDETKLIWNLLLTAAMLVLGWLLRLAESRNREITDKITELTDAVTNLKIELVKTETVLAERNKASLNDRVRESDELKALSNDVKDLKASVYEIKEGMIWLQKGAETKPKP